MTYYYNVKVHFDKKHYTRLFFILQVKIIKFSNVIY